MHPPFGVLFSFPSRYYCAIGFRTYLELGVSVSHLHARYPARTTLECTPALQTYSYGTITLSGVPFQETSPSSALQLCASEHHISRKPGIRFALCRVRSPLLTASQLLSFPFPTEMFHFGKFLLLTEVTGCPIRESPVLRLHAPRRSFSQLATPFISVLNLAIH